MPKTIGQRVLHDDDGELMEAVSAGESFVITRIGEPVAELRPLRPLSAGRRTFISRDEISALANANARVDRRQFRIDLDRAIGHGR